MRVQKKAYDEEQTRIATKHEVEAAKRLEARHCKCFGLKS